MPKMDGVGLAPTPSALNALLEEGSHFSHVNGALSLKNKVVIGESLMV